MYVYIYIYIKKRYTSGLAKEKFIMKGFKKTVSWGYVKKDLNRNMTAATFYKQEFKKKGSKKERK